MKLIEAVSKRLDTLLKEKHLKQNHLALKGGIPRSTISVILSAKRNTVELNTIYEIFLYNLWTNLRSFSTKIHNIMYFCQKSH